MPAFPLLSVYRSIDRSTYRSLSPIHSISILIHRNVFSLSIHNHLSFVCIDLDSHYRYLSLIYNTYTHTYIHTYIYMPTHTVRSMSVKFIVLHCSESSCVNTQEIEAQGGLIEKLRIKSAALNETQRGLILSPHFLIVLGVFISLFLSPLLATVYLRQTNTKLIKRSNNQANQADRSLNCKITFMDSIFLYSYLNLLFYFFFPFCSMIEITPAAVIFF